MLWGEYILPQAEAVGGGPEGQLAIGMSLASLIPKTAGSYLGAHLYVPRAWWFWKLSLLPALPVTMALSLTYYAATSQPEKLPDKSTSPYDVMGWQQTSEEFPQVRKAPKTAVVNAAWSPSTSKKVSAGKRFVEAAPFPVQLAVEKAGVTVS